MLLPEINKTEKSIIKKYQRKSIKKTGNNFFEINNEVNPFYMPLDEDVL